MQTKPDMKSEQNVRRPACNTERAGAPRKPFAVPRLDRHAPLPAVTAGSVMI